MTMKLSDELNWRGFINQSTFQDINWLDKPRTVYLGVDPTAESLHVGNLASFMPLRHMLDHGWKVIIVIGGGTGMIGDPGGKSEERNLLSLEKINSNKVAVQAQIEQLFGSQKFILEDNYNWLSKANLLEFLRDIGKHFSITPLVQRDYIAKRLGEGGAGISYTEFSYTLLQGYDYLQLYKKYDCQLQFGGSDQWGNMLSGVELIRRKEGGEAHVLSGPLIVDKSTGNKFGKSEGGAIWLDANRTSIYKFYQFWLNVDDQSVGDYLKYFTLLNREQISKLMKEFEDNPATRLAQKALALEVTSLVHGPQAAKKVEHISDVLFGDVPFADLSEAEVTVLKEELLVVKGKDDFAQTLVDAKLASSKTEASHFLGSGAIRVNGKRFELKEPQQAFKSGAKLVQRGKNSFAIVED